MSAGDPISDLVTPRLLACLAMVPALAVVGTAAATFSAVGAAYLFEADGAAFMDRLKVLDVRYRNLMEATNGGDLAKAAAMKGEAGREADRRFRAFAHDDPAALAAWAAMRKTGANLEQGVHDLVAAERIPGVGKVLSTVKLLGSFQRWMRERAAGSPVKFEEVLKMPDSSAGNQAVRDATGTAGARAATMGQ
jgi:hypothetical protein